MRKSFSILVFACSFVLLGYVGFGQTVTTADEVDARSDPREVSARLASKDPVVRQQAAESLARLAAVDQKKLLEGYRLQENDKRVRLALDWALFRVGKTDSLYLVITQLDSERHDQAESYLEQLESPSLLHGFLQTELKRPRITVGIIEALGKIGDSESLQVINSLRDSLSPGVAAAAEIASERIESRLAQVNDPLPSRPRTIPSAEKKEP